MKGEHAQRSHRHRSDDPRRAPGATPRQAAPGEPHSARTAGATLVDLQDEYCAWLDNLPDNLEGSRLADKLQAIAELDLEELQAIDPPRGYGRD